MVLLVYNKFSKNVSPKINRYQSYIVRVLTATVLLHAANKNTDFCFHNFQVEITSPAIYRLLFISLY